MNLVTASLARYDGLESLKGRELFLNFYQEEPIGLRMQSRVRVNGNDMSAYQGNIYVKVEGNFINLDKVYSIEVVS